MILRSTSGGRPASHPVHVAILVAAVAGCGGDDPTGGNAPSGGPPAGTLSANLTGATEVPGPGDPDGGGSARITADAATGELCYEITVLNIDPAFAAHIHDGAAGQEGGIAVGLGPPTDGSATGCFTGLDTALIGGILRTPSAYYVNVHTQPYPAGAVRGQLMR